MTALQIVDVERCGVSDEDVLRVAQMEIHPDIRRWDTDYASHSDDLDKNLRGFRAFFDRVSRDENQLCLLAKLHGEVVGFLGIHRFEEPSRSHIGDVGIMVHPDHQGRGIGTELLKASVELSREKGFRRLEADTLETNNAMRRTAEKTGFRLEGVRIKTTNMRGKLENSALYGLVLWVL